LAVLWGIFGVDQLLNHALDVFGVQPWTEQGLWGILAAPFLHANLAHLAANSVSFLVLGWLVLLRSTRHFVWVSIAATIGGGLVAWLLGAPGSRPNTSPPHSTVTPRLSAIVPRLRANHPPSIRKPR
jgi:membrane associated rhomboid family serine protease